MGVTFGPLGPCLILMADDDENDAFLFGRALTKSATPHSMMHVKDGREAMTYLRGEEPYHDRQRFPDPHLLILDLKMPNMNGFEVLQAMRRDKKLSKLATVVMSGSNLEEDRTQSLALGA